MVAETARSIHKELTENPTTDEGVEEQRQKTGVRVNQGRIERTRMTRKQEKAYAIPHMMTHQEAQSRG